MQSSGLKQVDASAKNPYATAVGGTSLAIGAQGQYKFESGWGTRLWSLAPNGKSGSPRSSTAARAVDSAGCSRRRRTRPGSSQRDRRPAGRFLTSPWTLIPTPGCCSGSPSSSRDGVFYDEARAGGTSLSAPLFAAVQALTSQAQHTRLGFANPRIYALARLQARGKRVAAFRDITRAHDGAAVVRADFVNGVNASDGFLYTVRSMDDDTSLATRAGWDDVTGVGTPTAAYYTATGR